MIFWSIELIWKIGKQNEFSIQKPKLFVIVSITRLYFAISRSNVNFFLYYIAVTKFHSSGSYPLTVGHGPLPSIVEHESSTKEPWNYWEHVGFQWNG